jgi:kynurenine formamidase
MKRHADKVRPGSRLIFHTGWDKMYPKKEYFGGQPYLSVEASTWLAEQGVWCVALDCPTTYPAEYTPSHHSLLNAKAEVLIIEGLRGLERLKGTRVILMALPLRIRGRDGSPCRAMAIDGDVEPLVEIFEKLEFSPQY